METFSDSAETQVGFEEQVRQQSDQQINQLQKGISSLMEAVAALIKKIDSMKKM